MARVGNAARGLDPDHIAALGQAARHANAHSKAPAMCSKGGEDSGEEAAV